MTVSYTLSAVGRMILRRLPRFGIMVATTGFVLPVSAQNYLYAAYKGKYVLVRRVEASIPSVRLDDGTWAAATEGHYLLKAAPEYLPILVAVDGFKLTYSNTTYVDADDAGHAPIDLRMGFEADLKSSVGLDDVFVVLAITTQAGASKLFMYGVGRLEPHRFKHFLHVERVGADLGQVQYQVHIFVGGREAFNSTLRFEVQEQALDRMVAARIGHDQDVGPRPLITPAPDYPDALRKTKQKGQAVLAFRIGVRGEILEPTVTSATDPAFGEAALAAIRLWRFLPQVRGGSPVETAAEMPFNFAPPS